MRLDSWRMGSYYFWILSELDLIDFSENHQGESQMEE